LYEYHAKHFPAKKAVIFADNTAGRFSDADNMTVKIA
jgi:hypothetical protein